VLVPEDAGGAMIAAVPHNTRWGEPVDPEEAARFNEINKKRAKDRTI
jgi:hypothetical protein